MHICNERRGEILLLTNKRIQISLGTSDKDYNIPQSLLETTKAVGRLCNFQMLLSARLHHQAGRCVVIKM